MLQKASRKGCRNKERWSETVFLPEPPKNKGERNEEKRKKITNTMLQNVVGILATKLSGASRRNCLQDLMQCG